ncbi:DUF3144 domain-containing protein [Pseudohalioglobus sediminis]|uniref:DUF3144 domain-containing protein n=1 Tax=Pseudohalioglobus sediminis TaxID=2606449 RepID=A0A5B0WZA1_9GAMM|nr:DUF3144 domain-containing protein [Pseudohalioglobus sediminis]KAA1192400.1 DUF3144 domain-containing protein [Pseudohalioglobus sediminis]
MAKSDAENHHECMNRFIELGNKMKEEGVGTHVVSAALMSASAVYSTYVAVGNTGGLNPSGVDKIVDAYRHQMEQVQASRQAESGSAE